MTRLALLALTIAGLSAAALPAYPCIRCTTCADGQCRCLGGGYHCGDEPGQCPVTPTAAEPVPLGYERVLTGPRAGQLLPRAVPSFPGPVPQPMPGPARTWVFPPPPLVAMPPVAAGPAVTCPGGRCPLKR